MARRTVGIYEGNQAPRAGQMTASVLIMLIITVSIFPE